jgi:predicted naringenin-chalcone synthase
MTTTYVHGIGTAVPRAQLLQPETRDFFASQPGVDRLAARLIGAAFDQSAIDRRYSVIGEPGNRDALFADADEQLHSPSTGSRNEMYRREAPNLFAEAARDALERSGVFAPEITHVVTASCTGFFAPGPDFLLVKELGIRPTAERFHIGFMGCAAAFPALRLATRTCQAQPGAVVLVVCAEICSIHLRSSNDPEQIVASAVFADGAAAAVVSALPPHTDQPVLEIGDFTTSITSEGEDAMQWTVGDFGFEMTLTAQVPRIIGREIGGAVQHMLRQGGLSAHEIAAWAVHPGGRSVLDRTQAALDLDDNALHDSREVLRNYGNMSSATILFILQRMLADQALGEGARIASLCFGPGLTVETALFTRQELVRSQDPNEAQGVHDTLSEALPESPGDSPNRPIHPVPPQPSDGRSETPT